MNKRTPKTFVIQLLIPPGLAGLEEALKLYEEKDAARKKELTEALRHVNIRDCPASAFFKEKTFLLHL